MSISSISPGLFAAKLQQEIIRGGKLGRIQKKIECERVYKFKLEIWLIVIYLLNYSQSVQTTRTSGEFHKAVDLYKELLETFEVIEEKFEKEEDK